MIDINNINDVEYATYKKAIQEQRVNEREVEVVENKESLTEVLWGKK